MTDSGPLTPAHARRATLVVAFALALALTSMLVATAGGAAGSAVVGAEVASATNLSVDPADPTNAGDCLAGVAGQTGFGVTLSSTPYVTTVDCTVVFGSSNDTAMLRVQQADGFAAAGVNAAMNRYAHASVGVGVASDIYGVAAWPGGHVWATGAGGVIRYSSDGGTTWSGQASGTTEGLWNLDAVSDQVLWTHGSNGTVLTTADGGATWVDRSIAATGAVVTALAPVDDQVVVAVTDASEIFTTDDGGATWTQRADGTAHPYYSASYAGGAWWVGAEASATDTVLRSTDGVSWTPRPLPAATSVDEALVAVDALTAFAFEGSAGGAGWRTDDGGATWTALGAGAIPTEIWGVDALDGQVLSVATSAGTIWTSTDGGATFVEEHAGGSQLDDVEYVDAGNVYVASFGGEVIRSAVDPIPDYSLGTTDWASAGGTFGACLRAVSGDASTGGTTWTADTVDADCADGDADPWNAIPAAPAKVAESTTATSTGAAVHIRFGLKPGASAPAGTYVAPIAFSVVAPNA